MDRLNTWQLLAWQFGRDLTWLKTRVVEYFYPTRCVGCERMGVLLCDECMGALSFIEQDTACPRCGAPFGSTVCTECLSAYGDKQNSGAKWINEAPGSEFALSCGQEHTFDSRQDRVVTIDKILAFTNAQKHLAANAQKHLAANAQKHLAANAQKQARTNDQKHSGGSEPFPFTRAYSALEFNDLSRRLVLAYKDGGERRLAETIAAMLVAAIPKDWRRWADVITWIPADSQALKRRGFDHMALVAACVQEILGIRSRAMLQKKALKDQRKLNRIERQENMSKVFSTVSPSTAQGKNIILIDDVFTTGATLSAAAEVLLRARAKEIRVATLCRVW